MSNNILGKFSFKPIIINEKLKSTESKVSNNENNIASNKSDNLNGEASSTNRQTHKLLESGFAEDYQRSLLFRKFETESVVQQTGAGGETDLSERAERIHARFSEAGVKGKISFDDIKGDLAGLSPSKAKQLCLVYKSAYKTDLLVDISKKVGTVRERLAAFQIIAPERVHEQIRPLEPSLNGAGIIADPPTSEIVEGTNVGYSLRAPNYVKGKNAPPDFVRFEYKGEDRLGKATDVFSTKFEEGSSGNYKVTFELLLAGEEVPTFYTMPQFVRKASDAANDALAGIEQQPIDPETLTQGVDVQIELMENRLTEMKAELAKFPPESVFQIQPPEQKKLKAQIEQTEAALSELRQIKETLPSKLFDGASAKPVGFKAALVPFENPRPIPLQLYAKPLGNDTWAIVDATNPTDAHIYKGKEGGGIQSAWKIFSEQNNLPAGSIAAKLPDGSQVSASGKGGSDLKTYSQRAGIISIGFAAAGLISLVTFPPAAPFLFGISATAGALSGGFNIADRVQYGNFRLKSTETALDVASIIGGIAGIGGASQINTAAKTLTLAEGATAQVSRVGNFIKVAQGVEFGAGATGVMLISADYIRQVEALKNLPPEERTKQALKLFNTAIATGAIIIVGGVMVSRMPRIAPKSLNELLKTSKLTPELESLVRSEPGLQNALKNKGAVELQKLYDDFLNKGKSGKATSAQFIDYLPKRGVSVSTVREEMNLANALELKQANVANLPKRTLNELLLKRVNPELLAKYKAGELSENVEAAVGEILSRDFKLAANTNFDKARGAINKELNSAIGRNVKDVEELKQVLELYKDGVNRGSIGNAFYQSKLAQGERVKEFGYTSELWTGKPSTNRRADDLLIRGRRTLDVKTGYGKGYPNGADEIAQLKDYNDLINASQRTKNVKLREYLEQSGVKGGVLQSHDYLFLPNATTKAEDAARKSFDKIETALNGETRNIRVMYLGDDGNIYQLVRPTPRQDVIPKLVGNKLPN